MNFSQLKLINEMLSNQDRSKLKFFFGFYLTGMLLESFSIALVIPFLHIIMQDNLTFLNFIPFDFNQLEKIEIISISLIIIFIFFTLKTLFLVFVKFKEAKFLQNLHQSMSNRLFSTYLSLPYKFHLNTNSANLIRNMSDVSHYIITIKSLMVLTIEFLILFGLAFLLLFYEPKGTLTSLMVIGTTGYLFYLSYQKKIIIWGKKRQYFDGLRFQHLQQGFNSIKDIKIFDKAKKFLVSFSSSNYGSTSAAQKQKFLANLPRLLLEWIAIVTIIIIILLVIKEKNEISLIIPTLGLFTAAAFRIMPSIARIMNESQQVKYSYPALKTLNENLKLKNHLRDPFQNNETQFDLNDKLYLKDVSYKYESSDKKIFRALNLEIEFGKSLGIHGDSGVGKSTLINLICGLIEPSSGKIICSGRSIFQSLNNWRKKIGYVPQNIYLTDDTLKSNIAFGKTDDEIDNDNLDYAVNGAQLNNFINQLKDGLNSKVGEFGSKLSGGQRQRIGIARALYRKPEILILDEATVSLDRDTEKNILDEVFKLKGDKTLILISHNLNILQNCDKIFELKRGN